MPIILFHCTVLTSLWYHKKWWYITHTSSITSLTSQDVFVPGPSFSISDRIQHGSNGPLNVTSSFSTWIFCRGVSGFATDCPCDVWCRGLPTCLLNVGPPFGNRFWNKQLGCRFDIMDSISSFFLFDICNYICLDTSYNFLALSLLRKYYLFFQVLVY